MKKLFHYFQNQNLAIKISSIIGPVVAIPLIVAMVVFVGLFETR